LAAKASDESTQLKRAAESGTTELRKSLQQERERAERLEQDLAAARRDVGTQTALAAKASDESTQLKQAAESGTTERRKSLQQERERAERLAQDLAAARRDVEMQTALAAKASDESTQLKQAAESGTAELRKSLQQERERAARLEQDLSMARSKIYAYEAQASKASDEQAQLRQAAKGGALAFQKSAQEQRERAVRLEQDLASARRDLETQTALAAKASEEATRLKQVAEQDSAELRRSFPQERDRAEGLERDLAFARQIKDAPAAPGAVTVGEIAQDKRFEAHAKPIADQVTVAETLGEPQPNPEDAAEAARLVARASVLLGRGDIGAARIVLERAAETGSAQASFTLAETYDPFILPKWGTYGTRGDATKARDLYAKAEAGGIKEAKERFDALRR
jgi:DNA repair exonuclease SbcCD ATPase subunit